MSKALDLAAVKALCDAATPGEWRWYGNTKTKDVHLATVHGGRRFVMGFERWGMGRACPSFQVDHRMVRADELVSHDREYRKDFSSINHPDAEFIAQSRTLIPALVAEVERLRDGLIAAYRHGHRNGYERGRDESPREKYEDNPPDGEAENEILWCLSQEQT